MGGRTRSLFGFLLVLVVGAQLSFALPAQAATDGSGITCSLFGFVLRPFGYCLQANTIKDSQPMTVNNRIFDIKSVLNRGLVAGESTSTNSTTVAVTNNFGLSKKEAQDIAEAVYVRNENTLKTHSALLVALSMFIENKALKDLHETLSDSISQTRDDLNSRGNGGSVDLSVGGTLTSPTITDPNISGVISLSGFTTNALLFTDSGGNISALGSLSVDDSGNLLIGTTSMQERLTVDGPIYLGNGTPTSTDNRLYSIGGSLYWNGSVLSASSSANWSLLAGNVYRPTGFVGIGTSSPYAELSVVGDIALTGGIYDSNASLGNSGSVLQSTGSGVNWVATSSLGLTTDLSGSSIEDLGDVAAMTKNFGDLLFWNGSAWTDVATSSLAISTTDLIEDSNLFYTNARVSTLINSSSTLLTNNTEIALESFLIDVTDVFTNNDTIGDTNISDTITASNYLALVDWFATTTDGLSEGGSNLYYTLARFASALAGTSTDALAEGSSNLYFTNARVASYILSSTTISRLGQTIDESELNTSGTLADGYVLQASSTATGGMVWVATSTLGLGGGSGAVTFTDLTDTPSSYLAGDIFYASSSSTIQRLAAGGDGTVLKISSGVPIWGADLGGSGGGGVWATSTDDLLIYPADPNNVVVIGGSATTSSGFDLEIIGNALVSGIQSTYATTSNFIINSESFTDLTGTALVNNAGVLSVSTSSLAAYFASTTAFDTSAELAAILTDETGTAGSVVFSASPTFTGTATFVDIDATGNVDLGDADGDNINIWGDLTIKDNFASEITALRFERSNASNRYNTITSVSDTFGNSLLGFNVHNGTPSTVVRVLTLTGSGRAGIGTTSPTKLLSVAGDAIITGALFDSNNASGTPGMVLQSTGSGFTWVATSTLGFASTSALANYLPLIGGSLSGNLSFSGTTANIALGSNWLSGDGDDEGVFVSSTGNVGLGTSSPASKLDVWGNFRVGTSSMPTFLVDSASSRIAVGTTSTTNGALTIAQSGTAITDGIRMTSSGADFSMYAGSGSVNYISANTGSLALGNDIASASSQQMLMLANSGVAINNQSHANFDFRVKGDNDTGLFFVDVGTEKIGIATDTPAYTLTVDGDIMSTGRFYDNSYSAGSNGMVLQTTGSGFNWVATSSLGFASTSALANYLPLIGGSLSGNLSFSGTAANIALGSNWLSGDGDDEGLTIDSTGRAFLKYTTSYSTDDLLTITNQGGYTAMSINAHGSTAWEASTLNFRRGRGTVGSPSAVQDGDLIMQLHVVGRGSSAWNSMGDFTMSVDGAPSGNNIPSRFSFFTTNSSGVQSEKMRITSTGRVGIGTTSPISTLDVWGNFNVATSGTPTLFADTSLGRVGILNNSPVVALHIGSTSVTDSTNLLRLEDTNSTCTFTADSGSPSCGSDITLKKDIDIIKNELERIVALEPSTWRWKTDYAGAPLKSGFIAQEVEKEFPDLVTESLWVDGSIRKFLNVGGLMPYVVGAVKEQQETLEEMMINGTSTQGTSSPFYRLFDGKEDTIWEKMVKIAQGFGDGILKLAGIETEILYARDITAETVTTDELCLGTTCVTESELQALLQKNGSSNDNHDSNKVSDGSSDSSISVDDTATTTNGTSSTTKETSTTNDTITSEIDDEDEAEETSNLDEENTGTDSTETEAIDDEQISNSDVDSTNETEPSTTDDSV